MEQGCRARPVCPPWGTSAVPRTFRVIFCHILSGCDNRVQPTPGDSRPLGRVQDSQLPPPILLAALDPYFIHNGKERAKGWGLGSKWLLCNFGGEDVSCHPPHPPPFAPPLRGGALQSFPGVCGGLRKEPAPGHGLQKHHGQRVQTSLCKYTSPTSRSSPPI